MTREELLVRLDEISELEDNWDYDGSGSIDKETIENARKIITEFKNLPYFISPTPFGVQLEWENEKYYIEIEVERDIDIFIMSHIKDTYISKTIEFKDYMLVDSLIELFINR